VKQADPYDPLVDVLLQGTRDAILRSQELIAKAKELQRQSDQLGEERRESQTA